MSIHLTPAERKVVEVVNSFAFLNPFSSERDAMERLFSETTGGKPSGTVRERFGGFFQWLEQLPPGKRDFAKFSDKEQDAMRTVFLFEGYHCNVAALDELIATQVVRGEKSCPAPFGRGCVERMVSRGFTHEEAVRYF